jgi:mono/diheme cytochrome c family protein
MLEFGELLWQSAGLTLSERRQTPPDRVVGFGRMKNTFAVTMTLLLALTLGGSIAGYRLATAPNAEEAAKGGAASIGDPTVQDVKSEDAPSAQSAATGAAGAPGAQGDVRPDQLGGTNAGQNGAVIAPGGQEGGGAEEAPDTEQGDEASEAQPSAVPSPSAPESGGGGTQVGQTGASNVERSSAANPTISDEKAAEISSALGGAAQPDGEATAPAGQQSGAEQTPTAPATQQEGQAGEPTSAAQSGGAAASGAAPAGTATAGDAAAGQTVYVSNCSGCHGANGQGVVGPSLVTANGPKSWTLAQFTTTLREGRTPERELNATMPRFSEAQLSDAQVADLFAYIKTLN